MLKISACRGEPTAWKGTIVVPLPKAAKTTSANSPVQHRPVHLTSTFALLYHRLRRRHLQPPLPSHALPTQCRGLQARSTDFGAHLLRQVYAVAHQRKRALLTISIDFTAAFDSLTRTTVYIDPNIDDPQTRPKFHQRIIDAHPPHHHKMASPTARRLCKTIQALGDVLLVPPPPHTPAPHTYLRFTNRYRHLGNPITTPTNVPHEAHHRAAQARTTLHEIPSAVLRILSTPQRLSTLTALVTSRLMFAVKTWTIHNDAHTKTMDRALHDTYARALGLAYVQRKTHHIDDRQLRAALAPSAPTFAVVARARRLRYLKRLLNIGPNLLFRLTFYHDPITKWELTLRTDLIWLRLYNND